MNELNVLGFLSYHVWGLGFSFSLFLFFFPPVVLLWCVSILEPASILQKGTLVFSAVSGKYIKT